MEWLGQTGFECFQQGGVVGDEVGVAGRMPHQRLRQQALRQPLSAPVVDQHRVAAVDQFCADLEVFLDELGAAAADDHRPDRLGRGKQRRAQLGATRAGKPLGRANLRRRRAGQADERRYDARARGFRNIRLVEQRHGDPCLSVSVDQTDRPMVLTLQAVSDNNVLTRVDLRLGRLS